jgi:hypothetical protein
MARQFIEFLGFIFTVWVLPVVINKSTEHKRFDWIHPHLRIVWTLIFGFYSFYLLAQPFAQGILMQMHSNVKAVVAYPLLAIFGASLFCGYYWFAGKIFDPQPATQSQAEEPTPSDTPVSLATPTEQKPAALTPVASSSQLPTLKKNEETKAPKIEPRPQQPPSSVNQTMTNSPNGIQAGRDATIGEKPSPVPTEKDRKP